MPSIEYTLRIDPSHLDAVDVAIDIAGAPSTLRLAMKVHPEYLLRRVGVAVVGYTRPRVRFTDLADVTAEQRAHRAKWLAGW